MHSEISGEPGLLLFLETDAGMETFLGIEYSTWWFLIIGATVTGYAILDGFDLGVGALHLFLRSEEHRRISINAIGPVWDGNEVWLVITGGALFAGFPPLYAELLSAFYIPIILFLVMLIFRAVSIEFRSKEPMAWWRKFWDVMFSSSSIILSLALGMVLGNVLQGIPINAQGEYVTSAGFSFINPFSLIVAFTTLSLFMMHGALYLVMKTEGRLFAQLTIITKNSARAFEFFFLILTLYTLLYVPHLIEKLQANPWLFVIPVFMAVAVMNITRQTSKRNYGLAFVSSAVVISLLLIVVSTGLYPTLLYSSLEPGFSLTVANASASEKSLGIMLIIAAIATPLVAAYTGFVFWTFRGKVKMDEHSY